MKLIGVRIPETLAHRLKLEAAKRNVKQQEIVAIALVEYFKEDRK